MRLMEKVRPWISNGLVIPLREGASQCRMPRIPVRHSFRCAGRASFGTHGAKLPALLRALVACGWYGIQTWFGGMMIYTLLGVLLGHPLEGEKIAGLGINVGQLVCFLVFWAIQFYFVVHGIESIRKLETWTAPLKILICFVLLGWVYQKAGGFGPIMEQPSQYAPGGSKAGQFMSVFWPSLTAMVGFWPRWR
ncbi:Sodium/glucose cotransporter 1 [Manis javanica]|nr:Sodium/glucose cotransporter 1 [Manis javanica]